MFASFTMTDWLIACLIIFLPACLLMIYCIKYAKFLASVEKSDTRVLSPLKENGENCGVLRRDIGSHYTMDEVAVYNNEFDSDTRLIMQGAKVTGEYESRRHVNMAIKMVYQVQSDEENWSRWSDLIEHYQSVQAKSYFNIAERIEENLFDQPPVSFTIYKTFSMIDFIKFKNIYSELEWNILVYRVNKIHTYYVKHKEVISKSHYSKHYM